MASKRQERFAGIIQRDLSHIFQSERASLLPNTLVTITRVTVTKDRSLARVFLSFFDYANAPQHLQRIKTHAVSIRYKLSNKIRKQTHHIPQLAFFADDTNEYVARIDSILKTISPG